jgi:septal ring factor EnvC (AmiA/AmiB activator)
VARQGVSKEQVFKAASALNDEGIVPTVQAVRERIGSGSFSTISNHLADWKAENAGRTPANIPEMPDKVMGAFQQVWATAAVVAKEGVETQRQALEGLRREMKQEKSEMKAEINRLEKALEDAQAKAQGLKKELDEEREGRAAMEKQVERVNIENARLDERAKAAETRATEFKEQVDELQTKFAQVARQIEQKR